MLFAQWRPRSPIDENDQPLHLSELRGLDKDIQIQRGELTNNLAKLLTLDDHVALEKIKLQKAHHDEYKRRITEYLQALQAEREVRVVAASANREALRTQINRIRETISVVLHEDNTLGERIRTLLREQGVTIVSILTALGITISTLVLALTGGGAAVAQTPAPTPSSGGAKVWPPKSS